MNPQVAYRILNPPATHFRPATCEEVDCEHYLNGWQVRVENLTPELLHAAKTSGRRFTELAAADGVTYLVFEPGQPCFKALAHTTNVGRAPLYVVDNVGGERTRRRLHATSDSWVDDVRTHQDSVLGVITKG